MTTHCLNTKQIADMYMNKTIEIKQLHHDVKIPKYATAGSAAIDLSAHIDGDEIMILPGNSVLIKTGIAVHINDPGLVGVLASRSGHGLKNRVRLGNGIGVIDSDYQQEIGVILYNDGDQIFWVKPGDRIAQLMFMPVVQVNLMVVEGFSEETGRGGFGSTGV